MSFVGRVEQAVVKTGFQFTKGAGSRGFHNIRPTSGMKPRDVQRGVSELSSALSSSYTHVKKPAFPKPQSLSAHQVRTLSKFPVHVSFRPMSTESGQADKPQLSDLALMFMPLDPAGKQFLALQSQDVQDMRGRSVLPPHGHSSTKHFPFGTVQARPFSTVASGQDSPKALSFATHHLSTLETLRLQEVVLGPLSEKDIKIRDKSILKLSKYLDVLIQSGTQIPQDSLLRTLASRTQMTFMSDEEMGRSAQLAKSVMDSLFTHYSGHLTDVDKVFDLIDPNRTTMIDHVAFRCAIGIEAYAAVLKEAGYRMMPDDMDFPDKHLTGRWMIYEGTAQGNIPKRIFLSQARFDELPHETETLFRARLKELLPANAGIDMATATPNQVYNYFAARVKEQLAAGQFKSDEDYVSFLRGPQFSPMDVDQWKQVSKQSEWAGWTLKADRPGFNHIAVSVHHLPQFSGLEAFDDHISSHLGLAFNKAGGRIIKKDGALEQSATMAGMVSVPFKDGDQSVPGSFVEYAHRAVLPEFAEIADKLNQLGLPTPSFMQIEGFKPNNADKIFESTNSNSASAATSSDAVVATKALDTDEASKVLWSMILRGISSKLADRFQNFVANVLSHLDTVALRAKSDAEFTQLSSLLTQAGYTPKSTLPYQGYDAVVFENPQPSRTDLPVTIILSKTGNPNLQLPGIIGTVLVTKSAFPEMQINNPGFAVRPVIPELLIVSRPAESPSGFQSLPLLVDSGMSFYDIPELLNTGWPERFSTLRQLLVKEKQGHLNDDQQKELNELVRLVQVEINAFPLLFAQLTDRYTACSELATLLIERVKPDSLMTVLDALESTLVIENTRLLSTEEAAKKKLLIKDFEDRVRKDPKILDSLQSFPECFQYAIDRGLYTQSVS